MSNPISGVTQAQAAEQATPAQTKTPETKTPETKVAQTSQTPTDTVQVSNSTKAILQEVQETHAQTIKEAAGGDGQAKRLLAEEAAANPPKA